jgi:hypothetical protein
MNIFNHIIQDDQITGVGVLQWREQGNGPVHVSYEFDLFTRVGIKTIKSKVCETFGYIEKQDQEILKDFRVEYWSIRKRIAALIGESDDQSSTVMQELKSSYDQLRKEYSALSVDLLPLIKRSKSKDLIQGRMQSLGTSIHNIESLANA